MAMPRGHKVNRDRLLPEEIPLTGNEQLFVKEFIKTNNAAQSWRNLGWAGDLSEKDLYSRSKYMLNKPNVQAEILRVLDEMHEQTVASSTEVMSYFTSVMRGEIKDQFGLDAPLSERTRAAQELAKRTIDFENRRAGESDTTIQIKLDWGREEQE